MIITSNGEVVTNNHVIAGATTITVTLYGSLKALPATLVDTDPTNDVALLQIDGQSNLPTVTYGNSDNVQVGDAVVAIGNALGLSAGTPTVTQGIISAKGRSVQASDSSGNTTENLTNMFQTDAAINPGNSGGPLVDSSGTGHRHEHRGGLQRRRDLAGPEHRVRHPVQQDREAASGAAQQVDRQPRHTAGTAFLGVSLETLTPQLRSEYNFVPTQGAVVLQVQSGSPADTAGLQQGDVITSFQGKPVTSADQLATAIQADKPGQTVQDRPLPGAAADHGDRHPQLLQHRRGQRLSRDRPLRVLACTGGLRFPLRSRYAYPVRASPVPVGPGSTGVDGVTTGLSLEALAAPRVEPAPDGTPPDQQTVTRILEVATTVPDHGGLRPWRFVVVRGGGRERFAEALEAGLLELRGPDIPEGARAKMRGKAFAAPCAAVLIASPRPGSNVPEWEQVVSASCTGYAVVLGASALGLGAVWKSAAVLDTGPVRSLFGLADHERLLGWVNLGSPGTPSRKKGPGAQGPDLVPPVTVIDG